jgi:hypothetical protein
MGKAMTPIVGNSKEAYLVELAFSLPSDQFGNIDTMGLYSKVLGPFYHKDIDKGVTGAIVYVIGDIASGNGDWFIDTYFTQEDLNRDWEKCLKTTAGISAPKKAAPRPS